MPSSWETEQSPQYDPHSYEVERFYCASTDGRGHHASVKITLPPYLLTRMQELVQSGRVPAYRTVQGIIRDALVHRLHWVSQAIELGQLAESINLAVLQAAERAEIEHRQEMADYIALVREQIGHYVKSRDWDGLESYIERHRTEVWPAIVPAFREDYSAALEEGEKYILHRR